MKGLGYLERRYLKGLLVHSVMIASAAGVPLGILDKEIWIRPLEEAGKKAKRKTKLLEEKESYRWLQALKRVEALVPKDTEVVMVSDRESDIFEYFAYERASNVHLLLRAVQNRKVRELRLNQAIREVPVSGYMEVKVNRQSNQEGRIAKLAVRFGCFPISVPLCPSRVSRFVKKKEFESSQFECDFGRGSRCSTGMFSG